MDVELRHLRYFVAVAEELHFGRAATRLHMAQPPLSQAIKALEAAVGTTLLARTSRSVALTPAGAALLDRARQVLAAAQDGVEEAGRIGRGEAGRLHVGFVSSAVTLGVPERIRAFRDAHPDVRLQLHEGQTAQTVDRLLEGRVDVGIVRDAPPEAGLVLETLEQEPYVAVVPDRHRHAGAAAVEAAALRDEPFVFFPRGAGELAYQRNLQPCREAGFTPRIVQEASHWQTVFHLVGAGVGVTVAPASAASVGPPTVRAVALSGTGARSSVQLVTREGEARPVVAHFAAARPARRR